MKRSRRRAEQQQTCKACGQPDKLNFHVPDEVWRDVVPTELQSRVVCLFCFDEYARENNVDYAASLSTLYFAGRCAALTLRVVSANSLHGSPDGPGTR